MTETETNFIKMTIQMEILIDKLENSMDQDKWKDQMGGIPYPFPPQHSTPVSDKMGYGHHKTR